jgi:hypothetical protein
VVGRSAVYSKYNMGPNTLPCGTPACIGYKVDVACPCFKLVKLVYIPFDLIITIEVVTGKLKIVQDLRFSQQWLG